MGSCGSSLNCNKCYTNEPIDGCDTEIEINPDIAGLGVLISFLFGAFGLSLVIVWGYFNKCLPLDVLSCTDQYALQLLKKRRQSFVEADLQFEPTPKQKRRTQIIVGFITVLSDQQLVTGVAILIAGLASRCRISFYEFNIVTYLAYFATFTHALSPRVLQSHLFVRKLVRDCRVIFTIGFLVIFSFSFVINTVSTRFDDVVNKDSLNVGNVVQCLFEASRFGKTVQFDLVESIVILGILLFNHVTAIAGLYFEPDVDPLAMLLKSFYARGLRFRGFSSKNASTIVIKAESKYEAWLRPPSAITKDVSISVWFLLDSYYGSCLSVLPRIMLGMTYGTGSVILAVWYGGLKPANGLHVLGFGQIVAIVLLALTILAAVEVINEQKIMKLHDATEMILAVSEASIVDTNVTRSDPTTEDGESTANTPEASQNSHPNQRRWADRIWRRIVLFGSRKSYDDLDAIRAGKTSMYDDNACIARKLGKLTLFCCLLEGCLYAFVGIGWNFDDTSAMASTVFYMYLAFRFLLSVKSVAGQVYFVSDEARIARHQQKCVSQLSAPQQSSHSPDSSALPSDISVRTISPTPSHSVSTIMQRSTARDGQVEFSPLGKKDTEADIGFQPPVPVRRKTHPPIFEGRIS